MTFKRLLALTLTLAMLVTAAGCTELTPSSSSSVPEVQLTENERFDAYLMDEFREAYSEAIFDTAFALRYPEKYGITDVPKIIGKIDFDKMDSYRTEFEKDAEILRDFDARKMDDKLTYVHELLMYELEESERYLDSDLQYYHNSVSPLLGIQSQLPSLLVEFPMYKAQDAYDYIEMLGSLPQYFDDLAEYERRRSEKGLFMSDATLKKTLKACTDFIEPPTNMLVEQFGMQLDAIPELAAEDRTKLIQMNTEAVQNSVIPAYKTLIEKLEALRGTGKNTAGLGNLPQGQEYYEMRLRAVTGSDRTVKQTIQFLDEWMQRSIMTVIYASQADPTIYDRYTSYKDAQTEPKEILDLLIERSKEYMPPLKELDYVINYVHASQEESSSPAFYFTPALDDDSPNAIYINKKYMDTYTSLFSLLAHEGYPGHMYQNNYFLQQNPHPSRRLFYYKGYSEGWADYIEMLAYEMSDMDDPALEQVCVADARISSILSARIDIGVNYENWTVQQVAQHLDEYGFNASAAQGIMDAVIEEPANYPAYCVGMLEFIELREYAIDELGQAFNEIAFHKAILDLGPSPFRFVKRAVEGYVASAKKSTLQAAA